MHLHYLSKDNNLTYLNPTPSSLLLACIYLPDLKLFKYVNS